MRRAGALAREAVERLRDTDALNQRAKAALDLSEVIALRGGRLRDVARLVSEAVDLFEAKGNVVDARRARARLAARARA